MGFLKIQGEGGGVFELATQRVAVIFFQFMIAPLEVADSIALFIPALTPWVSLAPIAVELSIGFGLAHVFPNASMSDDFTSVLFLGMWLLILFFLTRYHVDRATV